MDQSECTDELERPETYDEYNEKLLFFPLFPHLTTG